jgi:hypothetical protein
MVLFDFSVTAADLPAFFRNGSGFALKAVASGLSYLTTVSGPTEKTPDGIPAATPAVAEAVFTVRCDSLLTESVPDTYPVFDAFMALSVGLYFIR